MQNWPSHVQGHVLESTRDIQTHRNTDASRYGVENLLMNLVLRSTRFVV